MSMMNTEKPQSIREDTIIDAVKSVMADQAQETTSELIASKGIGAGDAAPAALSRDMAGAGYSENSGHADGGQTLRLLLSTVREYRPSRTHVLTTALLLLVVLKPGLVFGGLATVLLALGACYMVWGHDVFWGRVIALYRRFQKWSPERARRVRVRAYLMAKRWDRVVGFLPGPMCEALKSPDLRAMAVAEETHSAILSARLDRLG